MVGRTPRLGVCDNGVMVKLRESDVETLSLDEFLIENKEATYLLQVKGESMIEAGILPGDLVLVERGRQVRAGDIVVVLMDGEYTLEYFAKKMGKGIQVEAVVRGVIRKYK